MPDRLTAAAAFGAFRQRAWSLLVVCAFLVPAAAGAAAPMFAEASDNAAFQLRRDEIPPTARETDAAVVRLSVPIGRTSKDQASVLERIRSVPGLTEPDLTGESVGAELARPQFWGSWVSAAGGQERGRLFAVRDPAAELVAVGATAGPDGLWLPAPVAAEIGVKAGDRIVVTIRQGSGADQHTTSAIVSGVYAVDSAGRLPADAPGRGTWALRRGDTPGDTEYQTLPSFLLVGNVATVERLARLLDDRLFWSVEAALAPGVTLADARRTADGLEKVRRDYATNVPERGDSPLALQFSSGIGRIVGTAQLTTATVRHRTRPVEWAATAVGLASVLAVALLSARRREREIRHEVAVGMGPLRVGGLWFVEHLLTAALGLALGWLVAWQLVVRFGPPGVISESRLPAVAMAAAAVLAGLVTVAGIGAAAAARRVRPVTPTTARRQLPWAALLVVAALVAAGGLLGAGGTAGGVDLLVPLLVLAAIGVVAGWLPARLAGRRTRLPTSPARSVVWLARRRLGSGGTERRVAVVVLTAGLGMLLFALSAVHSTDVTADDRVAVAAGAEAVADLPGSFELDDKAALEPPDDPQAPPPTGPVQGVRTPPLPSGNTLVWYADVRTPLDDDQRDLLVIDPARFGDVALWGHGAALAKARQAVAELAARPADDNGMPRVIVVADPASALVDTIRTAVGYVTVDLVVASRVDAFPGMSGRPMYVTTADALFPELGRDDPRLKPRHARPAGAALAQAYLWSSGGESAALAITAPRGVVSERIRTAASLRRDAAYVATSRARGYQLAIAGYLALLAVLTLCIYAQRTAVLRRPTDLMLARVGLGRRRVSRARALEFVLLAAIAYAFSVAGVAGLSFFGARLLDDQPGLLPRFAFEFSPAGLWITALAAAVALVLAMLISRPFAADAEEAAYRDD